jgi:hypothetical protein
MTTNQRGKSGLAELAEKLAEGTAKHFGSVTQIPLPEGTLTPADITSKLNQIVTLRTDVDAARVAARDKVAAERAAMPALRTLMDAYVTYVKATVFGATDLADFGLTPKKAPAPLTADAKAAAVAKRASTRAARGTKGSKQKKVVKGNVAGITVTPVTMSVTATQPVVTSPAPAPAPAAPATGSAATPHAT